MAESKGLKKPVKLQSELAAMLGVKELPRTEITQKLWDYISNSRSILKILYNLRRKALSEPIRAPFAAFNTPCTASTKARRETLQLLVST